MLSSWRELIRNTPPPKLNLLNVTNADVYSSDGESAFGGLVYQARRTVMFRVNFKY